jgi:hypothetical protein
MKNPKLRTVKAPTRRPDVLWVERLTGNDSQQFVIYSPELRGFVTHFVAGRNVPCFHPDHECDGGHLETNLRENYLLHAWSLKRKRQVFVYLTPGAAEQLQEQLAPGASLRGRFLRLTRTTSKKARLHADLGEVAEGVKSIPPEKDFQASALNLLRWKAPVGLLDAQGEKPVLRVAQ